MDEKGFPSSGEGRFSTDDIEGFCLNIVRLVGGVVIGPDYVVEPTKIGFGKLGVCREEAVSDLGLEAHSRWPPK